MSLPEEISFDNKGNVVRFPLFRKISLALIIILIATLSFGIGRLTVVNNKEPIKIEYDASISSISDNKIIDSKQTATLINAIQDDTQNTNRKVIASKNGSKYHYPHCAGAKQIKDANKIVFSSPAAAEAAGYTLAINCRAR